MPDHFRVEIGVALGPQMRFDQRAQVQERLMHRVHRARQGAFELVPRRRASGKAYDQERGENKFARCGGEG